MKLYALGIFWSIWLSSIWSAEDLSPTHKITDALRKHMAQRHQINNFKIKWDHVILGVQNSWYIRVYPSYVDPITNIFHASENNWYTICVTKDGNIFTVRTFLPRQQ